MALGAGRLGRHPRHLPGVDRDAAGEDPSPGGTGRVAVRHVTESPGEQRCRWCGRGIDRRPGPGRPKEFCKASCRQADYIARQRSAEAGLSDAELIVTRAALDDLRDKLYVLEAAVEDVERDLADGPSERELQDAIQWLLEAARPLVENRANLT